MARAGAAALGRRHVPAPRPAGPTYVGSRSPIPRATSCACPDGEPVNDAATGYPGPVTDTMVFDADGTLVDTNYLHAIAWFRTFRRVDVTVPVWKIHRAIHPMWTGAPWRGAPRRSGRPRSARRSIRAPGHRMDHLLPGRLMH